MRMVPSSGPACLLTGTLKSSAQHFCAAAESGRTPSARKLRRPSLSTSSPSGSSARSSAEASATVFRPTAAAGPSSGLWPTCSLLALVSTPTIASLLSEMASSKLSLSSLSTPSEPGLLPAASVLCMEKRLSWSLASSAMSSSPPPAEEATLALLEVSETKDSKFITVFRCILSNDSIFRMGLEYSSPTSFSSSSGMYPGTR
mmetsp:Transcript_79665/g.234349  ORF Transcript_79665/g.234349 Transcript_79665/m.234349 type:complete len:202 (-) Transcript_79665:1096-1701(-)